MALASGRDISISPDFARGLAAFREGKLQWGEQSSPQLAAGFAHAGYEQLRAKGRPMLYHPNHYEGWQYIAFDEASGACAVVVMGGVQHFLVSQTLTGRW